MSHELLIQDLRQKAEEEIRAIWQEAETEIEKLRAETTKSIEQKKSEFARDQNFACEELAKSLLTDAENKAKKIRTEAERMLADQLYTLGRESLEQFRGKEYEELFVALARELPPHQWESVRVNPEDEQLARQLFPQAQVTPDEHIAGGLEVIGDKGGIRIVNTLEKRLERAWSTILPRIYSQVYQEVQADESSR